MRLCPYCKTDYDGAFCPKCGTAQRRLNLLGLILLSILTTAFALAFAFVGSCTVNVAVQSRNDHDYGGTIFYVSIGLVLTAGLAMPSFLFMRHLRDAWIQYQESKRR